MLKRDLLTTGPSGGSTPGALVPNRIEINDFVKDEKMFSLYIQALQAMMDTPQDDPTSFYQIASIHGLPYLPWDGVGEDSPAEAAGYCTHGSVLFPTWHRPYVALYEQILQDHAVRIARTYTNDGCCWRKAAADLRQPYWDWARAAVPPPEVISMGKVVIIAPNGLRVKVSNPLLRYRFRSVEPSFVVPYARWFTTIRHPTQTGQDAEDDVDELIATLQANQADLTAKTYGLLTRNHTWLSFSCHTPGDSGNTSNSLETIHDAIHDLAGGAGHMGDPAYAAFDPIFMLHHCQVDRLLSLWSALNPGVWVSEAQEEGGTYTIPSRSIVDEDTPLTPFRRTQGTFWTSYDVAELSPTRLGYSYPDFNGLNLKDRRAIFCHVAQVVNQLYAPDTLHQHLLSDIKTQRTHTLTWTNEPSPDDQRYSGVPAVEFSKSYAALEAPTADDELMDGFLVLFPGPSRNLTSTELWDWTVRIRVKKYEVGCSFAVPVFLGAVPHDPREWYKTPAYVGAHHVFVNSVPQQCPNCRRQEGAIIEGFVHLNGALERLGHPSYLEPEVVEAYLRRELSWRVRKVDGTALAPDNLSSLEVVVVAQPLYFPEADEPFLAPGRPEYCYDLTEEHVGGSFVGI